MALTKKLVSLSAAAALALGAGSVAYADTYGNSRNGASTQEVMQVKYNGAAWNYSGSGYKNAWYKYTREGRTIQYKVATNGKVTGSVWDNLVNWSDSATTRFTWGHQK